MFTRLLFLVFLMPMPALAEEALDVVNRSYMQAYPATSADRRYAPELSADDLMRGQFRPVNFTLLSAGMDGRLKTFSVRTGMTVSQGEIIASFACDEQEAEHQAALAREKAARKNFEVNEKLDAYQNVSELDLALSEVEVSIAEAEVARIEASLNHCAIRAPFDATLTEKYVQAHQYVNKGEPLVEIVDTRNLEIEMVLPSRAVSEYRKGRAFSIQIDETGDLLQAEIDRVVNVIDPVSQTIRVIGRLQETSTHLMPGMSGVVQLEID